MEITKKDLYEVSKLTREISMWEKELAKLENKSLLNKQRIIGMPFGSGCSDKVAETATNSVLYKSIISSLLKKLQSQRDKIMKYILSVDDSEIRQMLFLRCILDKDWDEIGKDLCYSSTYLKNKYYAYLRKHKVL